MRWFQICFWAGIFLAVVACIYASSDEQSTSLEENGSESKVAARVKHASNRAKGKSPKRRRGKGRTRRTRRRTNRRRPKVRPTRKPIARPSRKPPTRRPAQARAVDPDKFLETFGYLAKPRTPGAAHSDASRREAIKNYQRFNNLKVTGQLDVATRTLMSKPRCGLPDVIPNGVNPGAAGFRDPSKNPERYYVPGFKWKKNRLTWRSINYSPDMNSGSQRRAFYQAFGHWSKVAPLDFQEIGGGTPDIEIKFAAYDHGDGPGNAFDGQGGTLAHAYYPENGDTHFDESERWTEGTPDGTNLMIVATHEFGHALGLGHSNVRGALMAPSYQGYDPNFKLHYDDVLAITSLYGSRPRPTTPAPTTRRPLVTQRPTRPRTTAKPAGKPSYCRMKYDAVVQAHDYRIYVFKGRQLWRLNNEGMEPGYPSEIRFHYQSPPINIGAAVYSWRTRRTYFFKGKYVFKYYGFSREERKLMTDSYFPNHPHAALMGRDGRIYLLKGAYYYIFDEYQMRVLNIGKRLISSLWPGVPSYIEAAVRLRDGYLYFFKGTKYRKFDEYYRRVVPGYPKFKAAPWFGPTCNNGRSVPK